MNIFTDDGRQLDADVDVETSNAGLDLTLESGGGGRNGDYAAALGTLLLRLGAQETTLRDLLVVSRDTGRLPEMERRVHPEGFPLPLVLGPKTDVHALRLAIGRAVQAIGRADGARGSGNREKRLQLKVTAATGTTAETILGSPAGSTGEPLALEGLPRQHSGRLRAEAFIGMKREQVIRAMVRLDEGAEHPFSEPTTYEVRYQGRRYPPKAVFGLAASEHLGQALGPTDFSAGEGQPSFRILRELGFEIHPIESKPAATQQRTWALLCNPDVFDAEGAAAVLDEGLWALPKGDPEHGDRLLIWKTKGGDQNRGVVALGQVLEAPKDQEGDSPSTAFFRGAPPAARARRFRLRYIPLPAGPLWLGGGFDGVLADLSVSSGQGNKLYNVTEQQWNRLMALIGGWPGDQAGLAAAAAEAMEDAEGRQVGGAGGQGFGASPEYRKAVELRAMAMAEEHFVRAGYNVEDTSANKPYDLVVRGEGTILYVEVKGTVGDGAQVFLTKNEVGHARAHPGQCVLFVVSGILVAEGADGRMEATGGVARLTAPWRPAEEDLTAMMYRYVVPEEAGNG